MTFKRTLMAASVAALCTSPAHASLLFSEYLEGSGNNKALELLNTSAEPVDLAAWEIQVYFNGNNNAGLTLNLNGTIAPGGHFVVASSQADEAILAVADQTTGAGLFNGDDAVTLLNGGLVVDSIGQVGVDPGSYWGDDVRTQNTDLRRRDLTPDNDPYDAYEPALHFDAFPLDDFSDLGMNGGDPADPDDPDQPGTPTLTCGEPATLVSTIQGDGDTSPLNGESVQIEAVVTGVFNGDDGFGGFHVEEEAVDRDSLATTSEGLFIYAPDTDTTVEAGQTLRIAGTVTEYNGLTELGSITGIADCGPGDLPAPATISLPWASLDDPEAFESMRVTTDRPLVVNDTYDLGRYGSLTLGSTRHFIPTNVASPGSDAQAIQQANERDRLILDDGSNRQNPAVVPYPSPALSATNTVRGGDKVDSLVGVLEFRFDAWRLQPLQSPEFMAANPRQDSPELAASGNLVVTSFNVLNFFNGDGMGGGFPTARGADTAEELQRQTAKLVSAIRATNADVVGLMEIENDGYGDESAIRELADALGSEWQAVDPGLSQLGSDEIAVGFVYRTDRAETVGDAAVLASAPFQDLNRQPLVQTFRPVGSDDGVTLVVNHFKSKGCGEASGADADQGDGQGCWNPTRVQAASALANWLDTDPTGTGEQDRLILGDLNSYALEDPITTLTDHGYTDLVNRFEGDDAYSYVYFGEAGYLDHALASPELLDKVLDTAIWTINADEPRALDYNTEFKSPQQQADWYSTAPWRASDHDPVIVVLELAEGSDDLPADLNGDGRVDGRDLVRFLLAGLFGKDEHLDLNGDGRVNGKDLITMLAAIRQA